MCGNEKDRVHCTEHYCQLECAKRRMEPSLYCDEHTCPIDGCGASRPCAKHTCRYRYCGEVVAGEFCHDHDWHDYATDDERFNEARRVLNTLCFCRDPSHSSSYIEPCMLTAYRELVESFEDMVKVAEKVKHLKMLQNVIPMKNGSITLKMTEEYGLVCDNYCSYGYCHCDCVPRIDVDLKSFLYEKEDDDGQRFCSELNNHDVYLLSERVLAEDSHCAWTIPKHVLDGNAFETEDQLMELVFFEDVVRY